METMAILCYLFQKRVEYSGEDDFVNRENANKAVRAIVESQFLNMKVNSSWIKLDLNKVIVTGGGAKSFGICQTIANIFQVPVERLKISNSAALGAAIRATHAVNEGSWQELVKNFCSVEEYIFQPNQSTATIYAKSERDFSNFLKLNSSSIYKKIQDKQ